MKRLKNEINDNKNQKRAEIRYKNKKREKEI